jgi:hypothetical protein
MAMTPLRTYRRGLHLLRGLAPAQAQEHTQEQGHKQAGRD